MLSENLIAPIEYPKWQLKIKHQPNKCTDQIRFFIVKPYHILNFIQGKLIARRPDCLVSIETHKVAFVTDLHCLTRLLVPVYIETEVYI